MDGAIGEDEEDLILVRLSNSRLGVLFEGVQNFAKISWARKLNSPLLQPLSINVKDVLNSSDLRSPPVPIQSETVISAVFSLRYTPESKSRKLPVVIIRLENLTHSGHGRLILVESSRTSHVVQ